jgi:hypothetical protein
MTAEPMVAAPTVRTRRRDTGLDRQLAAAAVSHPGGRPWYLRPVDGGVEVHVEGRLGAAPTAAGLHTVRIMVGTAVRNLRLGAAMLGHRPVVTLFPPTAHGTVFAVVRRGAPAEPTAMERALAGIALQVGRYLPPVGEHTVPDAVVHHARAAVEAEGLWLRSVDDAARGRLALIRPAVAEVPATARLVVIGGNHDVAAVHLQAGQALQSLVLAMRLVGHTAAVSAWPTDLTAVHPMPESIGGHGGFPQLLVAIGRPTGSGGG